MIDPSDLPEPPIPTRAARAARLAALPFRCTHTGCYETLQQAGQCTLHQGCEFGAHRHPCPAAAEIEEALLARFLAKVSLPDSIEECWIWTGATTRRVNGYGRFSVMGRLSLAHRFAYEFARGPIPAGLEIDHLCRTPPCVNPWHLEPVTRSVNVRRGTAIEKSIELQRSKTACPAGHPYDEANTYLVPGSNDHRQCRACKADANRRHDAKRKAARRTSCCVDECRPPAHRPPCPVAEAIREAEYEARGA